MAYCRLGPESDVYLYHHINGGRHCCGCQFGHEPLIKTRKETLAHLKKHIDAGHKVPAHAITRLESEIKTK